MNIDLDYFFWHENDEDRISGEMFSDEYIRRFCEGLRLRIEDGTIAVTTIALTPSKTFTGGWEASERILERVLSGIGIQFQLPRSTSPKSASKT
jgi:hypothetical protein